MREQALKFTDRRPRCRAVSVRLDTRHKTNSERPWEQPPRERVRLYTSRQAMEVK